MKIFIDGVETPLTTDKDVLKDSIRLVTSFRIGQRSKGALFERGRVQDVRIYGRKLSAKEVDALAKVVQSAGRWPFPRTSERRNRMMRFTITG